jgi:hypothetical protein
MTIYKIYTYIKDKVVLIGMGTSPKDAVSDMQKRFPEYSDKDVEWYHPFTPSSLGYEDFVDGKLKEN